MRVIFANEVRPGMDLVVEQRFGIDSTTVVTTVGTVDDYKDEFVFFKGLNEPVNVHPHVGMPNVYIYER